MRLPVCILALLAASLPACSDHMLARQMVTPPNELRQKLAGPLQPIAHPTDGHLRIAVGPPAATLSAWVTEPPRGAPPRGTLLIVHGFLADHSWLDYATDAFAKAGYRTVAVDLRGHGESTGKHITFGVVESRDLVQLTDYLQQHHLCGDHLGVYGVSLGAATAIQFAVLDPRVSAVVAVAPFATFSGEVPHFGRTMLPLPGWFLSNQDYAQIVRDAGEIANFNPADADPLAAIRKTHIPILLLHGDADAIIPMANSQKLHDADPDRSEFHPLHGEGHVAACFDFSGEARRRAIDWFHVHLPAAPATAAEPPQNSPPPPAAAPSSAESHT
ncbi:MAG TPA: alpha/beta fold hydrolase [Phycisphaerae bacterium]|nr:alpha/beta fold hydrolase [Phycisphaerae bacterium]